MGHRIIKYVSFNDEKEADLIEIVKGLYFANWVKDSLRHEFFNKTKIPISFYQKQKGSLDEKSTAGYVYVLENPYINGLKIGKTTKLPEDRAKELSQSPGVPAPFSVIYKEYVDNCNKGETFVHKMLEKYRLSNKEFFDVPVDDVKALIYYYKLVEKNERRRKK